jgi:hypothetical protein
MGLKRTRHVRRRLRAVTHQNNALPLQLTLITMVVIILPANICFLPRVCLRTLNFSEKLLAARNVENHLFVHLFDQIAKADGRRPTDRLAIGAKTGVDDFPRSLAHTHYLGTTFSTCTFLAGNVILFS